MVLDAVLFVILHFSPRECIRSGIAFVSVTNFDFSHTEIELQDHVHKATLFTNRIVQDSVVLLFLARGVLRCRDFAYTGTCKSFSMVPGSVAASERWAFSMSISLSLRSLTVPSLRLRTYLSD